MKRRRSHAPNYFHQPTGTNYQLIGARECESGKAFVCIQNGDPRERIFLVGGFDIDPLLRNKIFAELLAKETKRVQAKTVRERKRELYEHARAIDEAESDDEAVELCADDVQELQTTETNRDLESLPDEAEDGEPADQEDEVEVAAD
jgi:hypothetical protein